MKLKVTINKRHAEFSKKCIENDLSAVREAIAAGFDLSEIWKCDEYPLEIAVCNNNVALARVLVEGGMPLHLNTTSNRYHSDDQAAFESMLLFGCIDEEGGNADVCCALLDYVTNVNTLVPQFNPLVRASAVKDKYVAPALEAYVEKVLKLGADVDFPNRRGGTQLHSIVIGHNTSLVSRLIAMSKDIDNPGSYGEGDMTPLSCAAFYGHLGAIDSLVANGANVNFYSESARSSILDKLVRYKNMNPFDNEDGQIDNAIARLREQGAKTYLELTGGK